MSTNINLNSEEFRRRTEEIIKKRLIAIGFAMARDIKKSMRGYGEYSRIDTQQVVKGSLRQKGKRAKYHYPSPPGGVPAVDTGRLRASITVNWSGSGFIRGEVQAPALAEEGVGRPVTDLNSFIVVVGTNVEYGGFLELGTSKMRARPYLRPILEKYREKIRNLRA